MSDNITLPLTKLPHAEEFAIPAYETSGAAGFDLRAAMPDKTPLTLAPFERAAVPTGLCFAVPNGYEMQVRPRSGLAFKHGISVVNAPGTIDSDYRGEIKILLINLGQEDFIIEHGMRIAQAIIAPVTQAKLVLKTELNDTERGDKGFGSTGHN